MKSELKPHKYRPNRIKKHEDCRAYPDEKGIETLYERVTNRREDFALQSLSR